MSLPAVRAVREAFPGAHLTVLARAAVADLYAREGAIDAVMLCAGGRRQAAAELRRESFDCAILLPNSFDAALPVWMARIPRRIGYRRDGRGWLLTEAIPAPESGEIPRHERFYYLELLRRAGIIHEYPACAGIRLDGREMIMLSSNDYLGLSFHPKVVEAGRAALLKWGTSTTGARPSNGSRTYHLELEQKIAAFLGREACHIHAAGYLSCLAT